MIAFKTYQNQITGKFKTRALFYITANFIIKAILSSRLIGPPKDWASSQWFIQGNEESIYGKLFKNNMEGLSSFYPVVDGIDYLVNSDNEVALFQFENLHSLKEYHCKVKTLKKLHQLLIIDSILKLFLMQILKQITIVWKAPTHSFTISMYMKKNSPFTGFISYKITKLAEAGITNNLSKRHVISEPNCKPMQAKGQKISKCYFSQKTTKK